ncbi:MAG TPA: sensor histidine kinase [Thermoanaerobaculia bacterium]|nr:sensor histidine kinase [Thermoanaerobaculia bacterium]
MRSARFPGGAPAATLAAVATAYSPTSRQERLIGAGRVVLAASSLLAVWLDPSEPAKYAETAYGLLVAYLVYAAAVALAVTRAGAVPPVLRLTTHVVDLVFFSLFIYFTSGPASPFNAYFVFALVCATLRWQWRGTLWTAVASLAAFVGAGYYFGELLEDPVFDLRNFIIRGVYMAVVAVLLGYLGAHEARVREEMSALAVWPREAEADADSVLGEVLAYAGGMVGVSEVLAVWTEGDEPWVHLAAWQGGLLTRSREAPDRFEPPVPERLAGATFLCADLRERPPSVLLAAAGRQERWAGEPVHPELAARFGAESLLSAPLRGEAVQGRLFFLGVPRLTSDELLLAEVVAAVVRERLEHLHLTDRLGRTAATEERIRLARDLHDGVLQSMTGFALRLEAVRRQLDEDPAAARGALEEVQRLIALEQRDLRFFIQELKPASEGVEGNGRELVGRLEELAHRIEREWDLRVELDAGGLDRPVPERLGREVYLLVREALVNAARHGEAATVAVRLADGTGEEVSNTVTDDGRGFPFEGRYADRALAELGLGPKSLRERVAALRGSLTVESGPGGSSVGIVLPTPAPSPGQTPS